MVTSPQLRAIYPMSLVRGLSHAALLAAALGGSRVAVNGPVTSSTYVGLDWFLLDLLFMALIFVPLERLFARLREQDIFRPGWTTDLAYFATSHLLLQALVLLTMIPAVVFFRWAVNTPFQRAIGSQPWAVQFVEVVVLADLATYSIHRIFHVVPYLWRFHQIHHSSQAMDWLAGSRLHVINVVATRAFVFIPLYALGFAPGPVYAYLVSFRSMRCSCMLMSGSASES